MTRKPIKKIVLAYSGGLDTSVILIWLQETYDAEVIAFAPISARVRICVPSKPKRRSSA